MPVRPGIINVMVRAAEKAGRPLVRDFGEVENLQVSRKGPGDFVSAADRRSERIVREELERARPGYSFLMEESGTIAGSDPGHRWLVDPLDGTTNFLHGIPHFAVSIALEREGEVVSGVVYDPIKDELFWAEKGRGAFMNDRRLRVSSRSSLAGAVVTTGIPHGPGEIAEEYLGQLATVMAHTVAVRRFGSAALDLAYVAAGRCEGFWEIGLKPWDYAAGALIVREAGGVVGSLSGQEDDFSAGGLVAANAQVYQPLLDLLRRPSATGVRAAR
jgi:myo-inositol-1(or 4)-monophosphatase